MTLKIKNLKVNDVFTHNWEPYSDWMCVSKVLKNDDNFFLFKNIISFGEGAFCLDKISLGVGAPIYNSFVIHEVLYTAETEIDRIKQIKPEYFL